MIAIHLACALVELALYTLLVAASVTLLVRTRWAFRRGPLDSPPSVAPPAVAPYVVVQLPLRNEAMSAEGAMRAAAALTWPRERFLVQVLDDSDDETIVIVDRVARELRFAGTRIEVVRRADRRGYKAGALALGMRRAPADRYLVLDADFRPLPDLLACLEGGLGRARAFCQARWSYRNRELSLLTRLQAAILDALFAVEQTKLTEAGAPLQFNGTAGLWRRDEIVRAGGWDTSDDALTEDLDLSFRAAEVGAHGATLASLDVSTELPPRMRDFRGQQMRWVRGAGLGLRTLGRRLLRRVTASEARGALAHLLRHARQPVFVAAALRLVCVARGWATPITAPWIGPVTFLLVVVAASLYLGAARQRIDGNTAAGAKLGPALVALSMGLAPALSLAFVGGLLGRRPGGFVRTEKRGDTTVVSTPRTRLRLDAASALGLVIAALSLLAAISFAGAHDVIGMLASLFVSASCVWVAI